MSWSFPTLTDQLELVLERSQGLGFLGPGPLEFHLVHARGFATAWAGPPPARAVDLGSGGGLPGLVLASLWPATSWILLDSMERRTAFLGEAVATLGLQARVVRQRAEAFARDPGARGVADLVTARGFGPPAVTAECAAGLLRPGGLLVVSEPPGTDTGRWPAEPLSELGLRPLRALFGLHRFQVLQLIEPTPDRVPRRDGLPAKRPWF